ncbi:Nuclear hormone receptor [Dirofilaria immitis]
MSQQFVRQDPYIHQISNSVIPTLATTNNNIINDASNNSMEKFFMMPTSAHVNHSNLPSVSTLTSHINISSNDLEESSGLIKSTTISLEYNSSTVIQNSNNASTPFSAGDITLNSIVNPEALNVDPVTISTLNKDDIVSSSQFLPSAISFANDLIPSNSSQFPSNNDTICNQEIIIKNSTNVNGNLSPSLTFSENSKFSTMQCWERRGSGNQSFDTKRSAGLCHVQSVSGIQESLLPNRLQQTSFPIESHESEMPNVMLSDATYLNVYTPTEHEFQCDTDMETNLYYMVQFPPTTYSSITTINREEEGEEEKVFKELVPMQSCSITDPFTEMINTTAHASSIGFQEPQSSGQLVLDSIIPTNEDDSTRKHYGVPSCEGCKSFFRRANEEKTKYKCQNQDNCIINRENRKKCPSCRLKKCLSVGMNPELVRSDCNRRRKREKRMEMEEIKK